MILSVLKIAIVNQKDGVGKTTTTSSLRIGLAGAPNQETLCGQHRWKFNNKFLVIMFKAYEAKLKEFEKALMQMTVFIAIKARCCKENRKNAINT